MELMLAILEIIQGVVSTIMNSAGFGTPQATILPQEIVTAVEDCGFFESIHLHQWALRGSCQEGLILFFEEGGDSYEQD